MTKVRNYFVIRSIFRNVITLCVPYHKYVSHRNFDFRLAYYDRITITVREHSFEAYCIYVVTHATEYCVLLC